MNVLRERCDNIKDGLKRNDGYVDVLQKDVSDLKSARVLLFGIAGALTLVFSVIGFKGDQVMKALNNQVKSLEKKASTLQDLFSNKLETLVRNAETRLNTHADALAATLPPVITILDVKEQQPFVSNYYHNSQAPDPYVAKMDQDSAEFDCSQIYEVPPQARGAIVQVVIYGELDNQKHVEFLCADSIGRFGMNRLMYENQTGVFQAMGGILFCPFLKGSRKFKYRLDTKAVGYKQLVTTEVLADRRIPCYGTIIGWS